MFNYRSSNGSLTKDRDGDARNYVAQTIGAQLRERREALGASLAEIESATKIRQKYLSALESDEWQMLPGEVIGRGFLRNYASYLGLESNELVERRRAITDPGTVSILSNTSSGVRLPVEREVDYRPREMDLREDTDVIETRQVAIGPYLVGLLAIALLALIAWSLFQYGGQVRQQLAGFFDSVGTVVSTAISRPTATLVPPTPVPPTPTLEAPVAQVGTDANSAQATTQPTEAPTAASEPNGALILPTATNTPGEAAAPPVAEQPTATPLPPTPTPVPQVSTLTTAANLRSGPGTNFDITGAGEPGQEIRIVVQSADGQWYQLDNGNWVFAQLVGNPPTNVAVQAEAATPAAPTEQVEQTPTEQPAAPPQAVVVPASCPNADAVITFPGVNQTLAGAVTVNGTANREPFQYWKVEVNGAVVGTGNVPIAGGALVSFDSGLFGNGAATVVLTAVDNTGNFSQCEVSVVIQN